MKPYLMQPTEYSQNSQNDSHSIDASDMFNDEQTTGLVMKIQIWKEIGNIQLSDSAVTAQKVLEEKLQDSALAYLGGVVAQKMIEGKDTTPLNSVLASYQLATGVQCSERMIDMLKEQVSPYIGSIYN